MHARINTNRIQRFYSTESGKELVGIVAGENGMSDDSETDTDGKYRTVKYSFDTKSLPASVFGESVEIRFMQSKAQQAHVHFLHIIVSDL